MQRRFGTQPIDDPSGMFGQPTGTPPADASEDEHFAAYMKMHFAAYMKMHFAGSSVRTDPEPEPGTSPQAASPGLPEVHQGPRGAAAVDDDALVDAWAARYFPASVGSKT